MKPGTRMRQFVRPCLGTFVALTLLTGVAYPLVVTVVAKVVFPAQADGSLLMRDGRAAGSRLLGQPFSSARYFWGRPSATEPQPYNGAASTGSNLGPTNAALAKAVKARVSVLRAADPQNARPVPIDLVTASASGLDPHISPAAAEYQVERVSRARGLAPVVVRGLVADHTEQRTLGLLGEPRVHVLELNLALDAMD
jgi:K+-transporting ATPase ATPase C chain